MLTRRVRLLAILMLGVFVGVALPALRLRAAADLPSRLTDDEFWHLTDALSEPDGSFRSDNFLSNESGYQTVIPDLIKTVKPGGVYLGVAPEINFTYIAALKPKMAFVIDIRRGNLDEHLLYKGLFELSTDRADFLSRLFSRKRPQGLTATSTIGDMFSAYDSVPVDETLFKANLAAVIDTLTKKHHFALKAGDLDGIEYVFREAFFKGGPNLDYSFGSSMGMRGGNNTPTYESLMLSSDGDGQNRGFLGSDQTFTYVKDFEAKNLLVPVVGNFGGTKAIRAVGQYVKAHDGTVTAFYLSNVEQYLTNGLWDTFCGNVASLPLDQTSTFIYSGRGNPSAPGGFGGRGGFGRGPGGNGMGQSRLRPIQSEVAPCAGAAAAH